jgi:hypothetical protein
MPSRYVCEVLDEMRTNLKQVTKGNLDYSQQISSKVLESLIEEAQTMVNRMEAKLRDYRDSDFDEDRIRELKKEKRDLEKEIKALENKKEDLEDDN